MSPPTASSPWSRLRQLWPGRASKSPNGQPPGRARADQEFLPAALEVLETPVSPMHSWLLLTICAFVVLATTWMFVGRIDIIAVAQGKIQPVGRVKLVQPLERGRVQQLLVANGARVVPGQVLALLEDNEVQAEVGSLKETVKSLQAEVVRRSAALEAAASGTYEAGRVAWPHDVPARILASEQRVLAGDLSLLKSTLESLSAQRRQKEAEQARLTDTIAAQEELVKNSSTRGQLRGYLESRQLGSKLSVYDAEEALQNHRLSLTHQRGQLGEVTASLGVIDIERAKATSTFVADNSQKLADAERRLEEARHRLIQAEAKAENMKLRAPAAGIVQALSINSVGQVVMPGEEVARVVPEEVGFEVECYVANKNIGFINIGQEAAIKVEPFPFTLYGALTGEVSQIGRDAIPEADAQQQEASPGRSGRSQFLGAGQRTQNLYFPVILALPHDAETSRGATLPISNGMAVTVEIRTGSRRIIDYLFAPLVEVTARAMRER